MNPKRLKVFILIILIILIVGTVTFFSLKAHNPNNQPLLKDTNVETSVPSHIIEKSNQFILSQVGNDFFQYISLDPSKSQYIQAREHCIQNPRLCLQFLQKPYYHMVYSLEIPDIPFVRELIEFPVDESGNLITESPVHGIPHCVEEPTECDFPIDETEAITIAKDANFEKGIKKWETSFHWFSGDLKTYVWTVSTTLSSDRKEQSEEGKTMVIDANTGQVLEVSNWWVGS